MIDNSYLKHVALAFISVSKEQNKVEECKRELSTVASRFKENPDLLKIFKAPKISRERKDQIVDELFSSEVSKITLGFLKVLVKRKLIEYIQLIDAQCTHIYNSMIGVIEGRIYTPFILKEDKLKQIEDIFSKKYGKRVVFRMIKDKNVIGGMKIYVQDTLYDYSLDSKLNQIRDKLVIKKM